MIDQHLQTGAGVTIAGLRVPRREATEFGVIDADADGKVRGFLEKPADPPGLPDSPDESFASMGNYVFTTDALLEALRTDAADEDSVHDMGGSIMPMLAAAGEAWVYDFSTNIVPGATERDHGYWRDVGTIDSYYDAHMDLVSVTPVFNLYNDRWPIYTLPPQLPAGEVRAGRPRGGVDGQRRRDHRRRLGAQLGRLARRPGRAGRPGRGQRAHGRRRHRRGRDTCAGRSWTRTSSSRRGRASASTPSRPRALPRERRRRDRAGQGRPRAALMPEPLIVTLLLDDDGAAAVRPAAGAALPGRAQPPRRARDAVPRAARGAARRRPGRPGGGRRPAGVRRRAVTGVRFLGRGRRLHRSSVLGAWPRCGAAAGRRRGSRGSPRRTGRSTRRT